MKVKVCRGLFEDYGFYLLSCFAKSAIRAIVKFTLAKGGNTAGTFGSEATLLSGPFERRLT